LLIDLIIKLNYNLVMSIEFKYLFNLQVDKQIINFILPQTSTASFAVWQIAIRALAALRQTCSMQQGLVNGQTDWSKLRQFTQNCEELRIKNNPNTPAHLAVESGSLAVARYFFASLDNRIKPPVGNPLNLFFDESRYSYDVEEAYSKFINSGYRLIIGKKQIVNSTPLILAIEKGYLEIAKLFLSKRADVNRKKYVTSESDLIEEDGPIHIAVRESELDFIQFLLNTPNIDVEALGEDDMTPLAIAARDDNVTVAEMLLAKGAKVNGNRGLAMYEAICVGSLPMVELLVKKGYQVTDNVVDPNDDKEITLFDLAINQGFPEIVRYLVDQGVCVTSLHLQAAQKLLSCKEENVMTHRDGYTQIVSILQNKLELPPAKKQKR
jgi:hypothetical protein